MAAAGRVLANDRYGVLQDVAQFTTACGYDRAGMGYSDPGPTPRSSARIASELAELVRRSDLWRPLVLVGRSMGGLYVRSYATAHESDIAGVVPVDTSHEDQAEKIRRRGVWRRHSRVRAAPTCSGAIRTFATCAEPVCVAIRSCP